VRKPPTKIIIEEWNGDGAIRIPDEALQELELDVGDAVYLIEEFVGNTRCLVLSKEPQILDRIDELTETWNSGQK
jgi:antitoxin component of MazEF toxin-antitoxin module